MRKTCQVLVGCRSCVRSIECDATGMPTLPVGGRRRAYDTSGREQIVSNPADPSVARASRAASSWTLVRIRVHERVTAARSVDGTRRHIAVCEDGKVVVPLWDGPERRRVIGSVSGPNGMSSASVSRSGNTKTTATFCRPMPGGPRRSGHSFQLVGIGSGETVLAQSPVHTTIACGSVCIDKLVKRHRFTFAMRI
jgi:hypothetical protein